MLERDYIEELIEQFSTIVVESLHLALVENKIECVKDAEEAVADLVSLPANQALSLSPESLANIMLIGGVGDSVAGYAAYTLNKIADIYKMDGMDELSEIRRLQAERLAVVFGYALDECPYEFKDLENEFLDAKGK